MGKAGLGLALAALTTLSCTAVVEGQGSTPVTTDTGGSSAQGVPGAAPQATQPAFSQCAVCHGSNGEGTPLGYELQHPVRDYSRWVVRNGRSGPEFPNSAMLAFSTTALSDAQLDEIFDTLSALPQPTTGEGLYLDYCANCHGVNARGGAVGKDISDQALNDVLEKVREGAGSDFSKRSSYMPAFDSNTLSDAEVGLIRQHIATL